MEAELAGSAPMTCQPTKAAWWSVRGMLAQEYTSRRSSAPALACKPITPSSSRAQTQAGMATVRRARQVRNCSSRNSIRDAPYPHTYEVQTLNL